MGAVFVAGSEKLTVERCHFQRNDGNGIMLSGCVPRSGSRPGPPGATPRTTPRTCTRRRARARYNRDAALLDNSFAWTGGTAMAAWGVTDELSHDGQDGWDGTGGEHPLHTLVRGNVVRETGVYAKQSRRPPRSGGPGCKLARTRAALHPLSDALSVLRSCWFQAKTARTTLTNNVCYNLARAGFNLNDGFAGGDLIMNNLIFNSCRESADHGPINSLRAGSAEPSPPGLRAPRTRILSGCCSQVGPAAVRHAVGAAPGQAERVDGARLESTAVGRHAHAPDRARTHGAQAPRNVTRNFLVGNYGGGNGVIDNDDGSEFFRNNHNFQVYGHQKFKGARRAPCRPPRR